MTHALKGYTLPLSPHGKAQIMGGYPWYSASAQLAFRYQADPEEVRKVLPEPYEMSETEPGVINCWFGDWILLSEDSKDMYYRNPTAAYYKECVLFARCRVKGVEGIHSPYLWVDEDFALVGGLIAGAPKKMGRIYHSHSKMHLFGINKAIGKFGPGTRLSSFVEAHGERLITGSLKLSRKITPADLPGSSPLALFCHNYYPSTDVGSKKPLVNQLIQWVTETTFGEVWAAEDATLVFSESGLEEHTAIKPLELLNAHYIEFGDVILGTKLVHEW